VITLREDARNHRGVLDARHDLQPRSAPRTALDLDAGHPLQTLRPASAAQRRALRLADYAALIRRAASNPIACRVKRPAAG
jgi:hypothetical protein